MQTRTWLEGLKTLVLAFPDRDQTEAVQMERGRLYQQHLADLTDEQWTHAVSEAVRNERWFPTIAALRSYAAEYRPEVAGYLPPPVRTEAEIEQGREAARRGLEQVKAAVVDRLARVPPLAPLGEVRAEPKQVVADGERWDLLQRQAADLKATGNQAEGGTR